VTAHTKATRARATAAAAAVVARLSVFLRARAAAGRRAMAGGGRAAGGLYTCKFRGQAADPRQSLVTHRRCRAQNTPSVRACVCACVCGVCVWRVCDVCVCVCECVTVRPLDAGHYL